MDKLKCVEAGPANPQCPGHFTHDLYTVHGMMSVIHRIETKDTGNPLARAYNKIKERTAVLDLRLQVLDTTRTWPM
jgi:hypothetical protein